MEGSVCRPCKRRRLASLVSAKGPEDLVRVSVRKRGGRERELDHATDGGFKAVDNPSRVLGRDPADAASAAPLPGTVGVLCKRAMIGPFGV